MYVIVLLAASLSAPPCPNGVCPAPASPFAARSGPAPVPIPAGGFVHRETNRVVVRPFVAIRHRFADRPRLFGRCR